MRTSVCHKYHPKSRALSPKTVYRCPKGKYRPLVSTNSMICRTGRGPYLPRSRRRRGVTITMFDPGHGWLACASEMIFSPIAHAGCMGRIRGIKQVGLPTFFLFFSDQTRQDKTRQDIPYKLHPIAPKKDRNFPFKYQKKSLECKKPSSLSRTPQTTYKSSEPACLLDSALAIRSRLCQVSRILIASRTLGNGYCVWLKRTIRNGRA